MAYYTYKIDTNYKKNLLPNYNLSDIKILLGETITKIIQEDDRELIFITDKGLLSMGFDVSPYEYAWIESITGDLQDLIGAKILMAEESTCMGIKDIHKWTFYKLATIKGYLDIRWNGNSCQYSNEVDFGYFDNSESINAYLEDIKNRKDTKIKTYQ